MPVDAGEATKDVRALPKLLDKLLPLLAAAGGPVAIVAAGGGSIGDLAGFVAAIVHRGVPLTLVPTTWLAAVDSAHGGKNALNVGGTKNIVGTFHLPECIFLSRRALFGQTPALAREALGEAIKAALLDGGPWTKEFRRALDTMPIEDALWKFLPSIVGAKYRVVRRDPKEQSGARRVLNFGHTVGHVLEAAHKLPHGIAVAEGMRFAIAFGEHLGVTAPATAEALRASWISPWFSNTKKRRPIARARFHALLAQDKKKLGGARVAFVFLERSGRPRIRPIDVQSVVAEARRQGLCR